MIPSSCAVCGLRAKNVLCEPCRSQFFHAKVYRCVCCALPLSFAPVVETSPVCGTCLSNPPAFDATLVATDYQAPIDQLVLGLKFGGRLALAPLFGDLLRDAVLSSQAVPNFADAHSRASSDAHSRTSSDAHSRTSSLPSCLIPVPLSATRLQQRGFNQSLEISRPLAVHLGVPVLARSMERVRDTRPQSALPVNARRQNTRDAFIVRAESVKLIAGRHVGVVDDVMTTGETLQEIATTLKRFGATRVTNMVFARTLPR